MNVVEEVDRLIGQAKLNRKRADDAEIRVIEPAPDIGSGDRADDVGDEQEAAQQTAESLRQSSQAIDDLTLVANQLRTGVSRFKLDA